MTFIKKMTRHLSTPTHEVLYLCSLPNRFQRAIYLSLPCALGPIQGVFVPFTFSTNETEFQMNCVESETALILDTQGLVVHCSPAAAVLLGQEADAMANHPVKTVFPGLPMSQNTPGYNVAYAALKGAQGQWAQYWAQISSGAPIALEILFACIKQKGVLFITLHLREKSPHLQQLAQA